MKVQGFCVAALCALVGCAPPSVPIERGIGFGDPVERELERLARDAELSGSAEVSAEPTGTAYSTSNSESYRLENERDGLIASPSNAAPEIVGLSDEQDFEAVAQRETIESDAERRASQMAIREQVEPTALPERPEDTGPNIIEYALNAPNVLGQQWYSRFIFASQARAQRNCAAYITAEEAQRDFLARGGPERDRLGVDPDGDGFACDWDPAPYIAALRN